MSNGAGSEEPDGVVLGIDFGSSNSCVAVWRADKNKVKIIKNASPAGKRIGARDSHKRCI
jgi:molecular chaperone DnaK (HSP70)